MIPLPGQAPGLSKFQLQAGAEDGFGAAIVVERGIANKLIIQCNINALPDFEIIIIFHVFLNPVVGGADGVVE